ncbi:hypothetical protein AB1K70_05090 [Bremerella sp. JC770]|uniref:hypothetical protein n=1 Tax=Bremerella sp. JC770 TaxID=3232137 RepID=UPI00345787AF
MKASTFAISVFALGLLASAVIAAEERTWTDTSGKTLTGELEEVTSDGKVKIKSNGQSFTIPIERFSDEDQQYIDAQKKQMEKDEAPTRRRRKSDLFDYRQWKDNQDNEIKAKYVRIHEGQVVLLQGRTAHKVSFYDLSTEDQAYLRGELAARNEANQIPPNPAGASSDGNPIAGGQPYDPRMGNIAAAPPAYAPPAMDDFAKRQQEQHEKMRREIEQKQAEARRAAEEAKRRYEEGIRQREADNQRREQEYVQQAQREAERRNREREEQIARMTSSPSMPQMEMRYEEYKVCDQCNNRIDMNIGAGDSCPHCGAFFSHEKDRFGNTTNRVSVPWGRMGIRGGAILGAIVGGIFGVIKWLMKKES